jgi:hypothetical protein
MGGAVQVTTLVRDPGCVSTRTVLASEPGVTCSVSLVAWPLASTVVAVVLPGRITTVADSPGFGFTLSPLALFSTLGALTLLPAPSPASATAGSAGRMSTPLKPKSPGSNPRTRMSPSPPH